MTDSTDRVDFGEVLAAVEARFTAVELAELAQLNSSSSGQPKFRLVNQVATWGYEVQRLSGQLDRSLAERDPAILGAYDLVGALFTRDRAETATAGAPDSVRGRVREVLDGFDAAYRAITVDDARDEITRAADVRRFRAGWWWHRIPDRGPVRQELDGFSVVPKVYRAEISRSFTGAELVELDTVADGDPGDGVLDLIARWGAAVRVVDLQRTGSRPMPGVRAWGVAELVDALSVRDRVERVLPRLPAGSARKVRAVLDEIDERHHAHSVEGSELLAAGGADPEHAGWWWHRAPADGPIRAELDRTCDDGPGTR